MPACSAWSISGATWSCRARSRASLRSRGPRGVRLLFQHDPDEPIGVGSIRRGWPVDCSRGGGSCSRSARPGGSSLMRGGALDGLSIGFRTVQGRTDPGRRAAAARGRSLGDLGRHLPHAARGAGQRGEAPAFGCGDGQRAAAAQHPPRHAAAAGPLIRGGSPRSRRSDGCEVRKLLKPLKIWLLELIYRLEVFSIATKKALTGKTQQPSWSCYFQAPCGRNRLEVGLAPRECSIQDSAELIGLVYVLRSHGRFARTPLS